MVPLEVVVFVVAVLATLVHRLATRSGIVSTRRAAGRRHDDVHLKVLLDVRASDDWNELLWHCIHSAVAPHTLHFGVLVGCVSLHDANTDVDSLLRSRADVHHCRARSHTSHARSMRRLVRHFVGGDETFVVVLDPRARLVPEWDTAVVGCCADLDSYTAASCPSVSRDGAAGFPLVDASGARHGDTVAFAAAAADGVQPSVAWCSEATIGRPSALQGWPDVAHVVPTRPVVSHDPCIDVARDVTLPPPVPRAARVGLTARYGEDEAIVKYGSVKAARLAVRFGGAIA